MQREKKQNEDHVQYWYVMMWYEEPVYNMVWYDMMRYDVIWYVIVLYSIWRSSKRTYIAEAT